METGRRPWQRASPGKVDRSSGCGSLEGAVRGSVVAILSCQPLNQPLQNARLHLCTGVGVRGLFKGRQRLLKPNDLTELAIVLCFGDPVAPNLSFNLFATPGTCLQHLVRLDYVVRLARQVPTTD
ncbi:hypothetical protein CBM2637_A30018 [Cupriavidus taiwanensis]|nr:hypothetical protein CBM2637_A30018 [Cupriavidus taiwanensis]